MGREVRQNVTGTVIIQAVGGDLNVRGRADSTLVLDGEGGAIEQLGEGQPYVVRCGGDCRITVPAAVRLSVQQVGGDVKITDLDQVLDVHQVGGDLTVRNMPAAQIRRVGGDLRIKWVAGDASVEAVGGDATIREVDGSVKVGHIGSDLLLRNIGGSCVVDQVGADLLLSVDFAPEREYRFRVGGAVLCRVQSDLNARFILPAAVSVELDVEAEVTEEDDGDRQIVTLGDGSATITIDDADELRLVGEGEDYMLNLGVQIEEELDARMSQLEEKLSQQLEGLDERIRSRTEQWAAQAERLSERAQRQAERTAERLRRTMDRNKEKRKGRPRPGFGSGPFGWSMPTPPRPPVDPVTEQERLMILKMVQEGKITIEEAERLLAALEP